MIEFDDQAAVNYDPMGNETFDLFDQVAVQVLPLLALAQAALARRLDADENLTQAAS
jgi:hypothetical protein